MVDKNTVLGVARLAHLEVSDEKAEQLKVEFEKILGNFNKLEEINTENVAPMRSPMEICAPLRQDKVGETLNSEELFANAPERVGNLFKVPPAV